MQKGLVLPLVIAVFGAGCAVESEPETQTFHTTHHEIMGGEIDAENTFVVGLVTTSGYSVGTCSGTLIAPNLVLTAQHCVAELYSEGIRCGYTPFGATRSADGIYVTTRRYITNDAANYHQVKAIYTGEKDDVCNNDIALLLLQDNIPDSEATPVVPRIDLPVQNGETYTAIGYGHDGSGGNSGVRRILDGRRVQCEGDSCPNYVQVEDAEFLGTSGTCQGDSGGPAMDAQGRVLGALSRGVGNCESSTYSAVSGWSDWIIEHALEAADVGGYEVPFWAKHGVSEIPEDDLDLDGITIDADNCPEVHNVDQADIDDDGLGDACDNNSDEDEIVDDEDNCPLVANPDQIDTDEDGFGDACDQDDDGDGVEDTADFCPKNPKFADYGSDCSLTEDIIVFQQDPKQGCQKSSTADGSPAGTGALAMLLGMFLMRRRRRED